MLIEEQIKNFDFNVVSKHRTELKINGLNVSTRVKQLFNPKYQTETKKIADRVICMQSKIGRSYDKFNAD
jgi:ABC-type sugar transport system ATPase subunit